MKLNSIDLNKLKTFNAVVNGGGYKSAEEELGLTRSAISQAMTALEYQIGVPLFQRKGRKLFPTKEAIELSKEFDVYHSSLQAMLTRIAGGSGKVDGLIRVGSYYEFAKIELLPKIKKFCTQHPNVEFKFNFNSPSRLQNKLERGLLDLNFSIYSHRGRKDIESKKIFRQELVLVAHTSMLSKTKKIEDLLSLPIIEYYTSHQLLPRWVRWHYSKNIKKLKPRIYAASAEMLLETVNEGLGIGVVPNYVISKEKFTDIRVIRPTNKILEDHIWLNQFKNQFDNSAHQEFYKFITSQMP